MPSPFYNNIKGTTAGTPGTGAYTPNAASSGFSAWSTVPSGWMGLVRFEDGSAWSLEDCYWDGTTLSRSSTQDVLLRDGTVASSTGSHLTLTSVATAAMVVDADEVQSHLGGVPIRGQMTMSGAAQLFGVGMANITVTGTGAAVTPATTNYLTEQLRNQITSVTTANGQAGVAVTASQPMAVTSSSAGRGGWEFVARHGATTLPTGPRLFAGMTSVTQVSKTTEPSALVAAMAIFGVDSTDTNIQCVTNSNAGAGTKIDTGIAFVVNGWYEMAIWTEPGSTRVFFTLRRLDTGAIFRTSTTTDVPATGSLLFPQVLGSLNGTNTGTAYVMAFGSMFVRSGS